MGDTLTRREPSRVGNTVMRFVNLISHRSGSVFAVMEAHSITLPQVLLLSRMVQLGAASLSNLVDGNALAARRHRHRLWNLDLLDARAQCILRLRRDPKHIELAFKASMARPIDTCIRDRALRAGPGSVWSAAYCA
jgi:hypothetical protein